MKRLKFVAIVGFLVSGPALPAFSTVAPGAPNLLTYQGRLQESGSPVNGNRDMNIQLCNAFVGPTCFPSGAQGVAVNNGLFRTTFTVPSGVDLTQGSWFLEVDAGPTGGALTALLPREQLTSSPYAVVAASVPAAGLLPGVVGNGVNFGGQVGIGTTNLSAIHRVTVETAPGQQGGIRIRQSGTTKRSDWNMTTTRAELNAYDDGTAANLPFYMTGNPLTLNGNGEGYVGIGTTAPNSALQVNGPITHNTTSVSGAYSIVGNDSVIFVNASGGPVTVTLPAAGPNTIGRVYHIYKVDPSVYAVTVAAQSGNSIIGATGAPAQGQLLYIIGQTATQWISRSL